MHLDKNNLEDISTYLQSLRILEAGEIVSYAEKPGEGNMNYTLRLKAGDKSFIIKQARPYVEKYPQIAAPQQRALAEAGFYNQVKKSSLLKRLMPELLAADEANFILLLQDLGNATDGSFLYEPGKKLDQTAMEDLGLFLTALHGGFKKEKEDELMANRELRLLNHEHIFVYPLQLENGFDLDTVQPGLQAISIPFKKSEALKQKAAELGKKYLEDADTLLHGDFYPGSWLFTQEGIKIIDPEFCFYGHPEFDVAVLKAHLMMAEQQDEFISSVFTYYNKPFGFNEKLFDAFTGMEIIRRLIGLAQLPLSLTIEQKTTLL
ncbi:MAG: phosphotransferase, partial [Gloeobacteraceae cyanobacterium ES-bin-316]|nr:phosphotransferase [Ferruginibacter sp.]